jgi:hypothetical protein
MIGPQLPIVKGKKGPPLLSGWESAPWGDLQKACQLANGTNRGLRLDEYLALDPDDQAAEDICSRLELEGKLPPTVAWRTWRNRIVRIYQRPPAKLLNAPIKPTISPMLELRIGSGQYCIIPPSIVTDPELRKTGKYQWLEGQSPDDIKPAEMPEETLEYLIQTLKKSSQTEKKTEESRRPSNLNFDKGNRDNSLYSVALSLRKGGMQQADIEKTILHIAGSCNPPMPEKEALKKVFAAFKDTPGERNLAQEVRNWIEMVSGIFHVREIDNELQLKSKQEKENRRKILKRLEEIGFVKIVSSKSGYFCKVESELEKIDFMSANPNDIYPIKFPFALQNYVNLYPKNIVICAGASNAGKTAFLLNTAEYNCHQHPVYYFSSEMGPEELRLRLSNFDLPLESWGGVNFINRSYNFSDVIQPNALNIIDYLEVTTDFFAVGGEIKAIFDRLDKGLAIIAIQKKKGAELGRGADFTLEKSRLYLSIDANELKIVKGKNWAQIGKNPNGMVFRFKLVGGCKFV